MMNDEFLSVFITRHLSLRNLLPEVPLREICMYQGSFEMLLKFAVSNELRLHNKIRCG